LNVRFEALALYRRNAMRRILLAGALVLTFAPAPSLAQDVTVGTRVEVPVEVDTYVTAHPRRFHRVEEEIVVGRPLPRSVEVYEIPRYTDYSYAYVNERRVIIEPRTRRIIKIIE
jgi:hypothetical protein